MLVVLTTQKLKDYVKVQNTFNMLSAICQLHSHRTQRAITKVLFRYNLSTTSSPPAKKKKKKKVTTKECKNKTGLMGPRRSSFKMNLEVNKGKRN